MIIKIIKRVKTNGKIRRFEVAMTPLSRKMLKCILQRFHRFNFEEISFNTNNNNNNNNKIIIIILLMNE